VADTWSARGGKEQSERAGAVPAGRRAGCDEGAPEHRRSGTAPQRARSPASAERRQLDAASGPAPLCGAGEQADAVLRETRRTPRNERPRARRRKTASQGPQLPTTGTPDRRGSGTAHDVPAPPPGCSGDNSTLRGCGALPERRSPRLLFPQVRRRGPCGSRGQRPGLGRARRACGTAAGRGS
jgi:hypothetical protein